MRVLLRNGGVVMRSCVSPGHPLAMCHPAREPTVRWDVASQWWREITLRQVWDLQTWHAFKSIRCSLHSLWSHWCFLAPFTQRFLHHSVTPFSKSCFFLLSGKKIVPLMVNLIISYWLKDWSIDPCWGPFQRRESDGTSRPETPRKAEQFEKQSSPSLWTKLLW